MLAVLAFLALCATCLAQQPHPCESPKQFEARITEFDREKKFQKYAKISYDETQRRVREIEEVQIGSTRDFFDKLYLHNLNTEYTFNLRTRKCNVTTLHRPWIPMAVPPDAMFRGTATIGAVGVPNEHVTVNLFDGKTPDGGEYFVTTSDPDCFPMEVGFFSNATGYFQRTFFDTTLGISDPMVFIPPRECSS